MSETKCVSKRGGFCANPFANRTRLDRLDFLESPGAGASPEKILFLQTITDAVHNYLFFGLGRNGTTAEEFSFAYEYLFNIRSDEPASWPKDSHKMPEGSIASLQDITTPDELTDSQFSSMCFDTQYEYSGLGRLMLLSRFLSWLGRERTLILDTNPVQVALYLAQLYAHACEEGKPGLRLPAAPTDWRSILIHPASPADVARLVFLPKQYRMLPA